MKLTLITKLLHGNLVPLIAFGQLDSFQKGKGIDRIGCQQRQEEQEYGGSHHGGSFFLLPTDGIYIYMIEDQE